ncbi:hypothetical protein M501DRAFT_914464, partial [Patellaria atrata CBS 101060]
PAVWQNIFLHTDNVQTFGRLMQVNRAFNRYLTSTTAGSDSRSVHGRLHVLNSETLWDLIRKRKYPNLPKPLAACSQREMWRLILSKRCQFCGKLASAASTQNSPFASGPGQHGIRPIWAFAIVICGPSSLLPALPYVFLTSDLHVVSSSTIQDSHTVPTNIIMVKRYYSKHVNDMERQLQDARELGPAAAEEWFKGLEIKGRETLNDAARWERWEDKGGVRQLFHFPQPRIERTVRDANEAKAARRRDIERRCLELEPPITPNILSHMDAFQAAIQISVPMTDKAWDVLKPRLLHQRDAAERAEAEKAEQNNTFRVKLEDRFSSDTFNKEVKEALEHEWEEIQKPIRQRLSTYADDIISNEWACGRSVTRDNCSKFAAEVLIRPVKDEMSESELPRILVLENMKWVFDNKIKPITEHFRKDLFLCNSCDGNYKFYGFEGVIQHFGAKHTNSFSVGNVVVSWQRAEWPEEPPFHPDPTMAKSTPLLVPSGLSLSGAGFSGPPPVKSNQEELNALSDMARLLWNNTSGVQDLSLSVRLYVIVHHVFLQFKNRFNREPSLDLFINALTQNQSLRPLKASNELFCKSCAEQNTNHQHSESAQENLASYNIESLAFHFKFNHFKGANQPGTSSGQSSSESKWNQDMIDLPEDVFIADLIRAPGMTEEKRKIFADVFP